MTCKDPQKPQAHRKKSGFRLEFVGISLSPRIDFMGLFEVS